MRAEMMVTPATPLWMASRLILNAKVNAFFRDKRKVLEKFDLDAIHDLRVSSRRLREAFALFAPCYADADVRECMGKIKKVTGALGKIRNDDEARLFFMELVTETCGECANGVVELVESLFRRRKKRLRKLKDTLSGLLPSGCRADFRHVADSPVLLPPSVGSFQPLAFVSEFGKSAFQEYFGRIDGLVPQSLERGNHNAQHLLRIVVKHFRYRIEALSFLFGPAFPEIHSIVKEYQEVLGKLHDMDVFSLLISKSEYLPPESRGYIVDQIAARHDSFFSRYCALMETHPLSLVCDRVKTAFVEITQGVQEIVAIHRDA